MKIDFRSVCHRYKSVEERFDSQVFKCPMSGCWLWGGSTKGSNNYGRFMVNSVDYVAHRYSWIKHFGDIPDGMFVLHKCDNSACVNPNHLFLGTNQDNSDDKVKKNRQAKGKKLSDCQKNWERSGERNGNAKLTNYERKRIIELDLPQRKLAKIFNVSQTNIWRIKHGARILK